MRVLFSISPCLSLFHFPLSRAGHSLHICLIFSLPSTLLLSLFWKVYFERHISFKGGDIEWFAFDRSHHSESWIDWFYTDELIHNKKERKWESRKRVKKKSNSQKCLFRYCSPLYELSALVEHRCEPPLGPFADRVILNRSHIAVIMLQIIAKCINDRWSMINDNKRRKAKDKKKKVKIQNHIEKEMNNQICAAVRFSPAAMYSYKYASIETNENMYKQHHKQKWKQICWTAKKS